MIFKKLTRAILGLALSADDLADELRWVRQHTELATKHDLKEMENRMAIKLSELTNTVAGLKTQVEKIWNEQQKKYDALVVEFNALKEQLDNAEVPQEAADAITAFQDKLKEFDDTIPDTTE